MNDNITINLNIPAIEKLVDYTASGIGAVGGPLLAPYAARQKGKAELIKAKAEADSLRLIADAQADARKALMVSDNNFSGTLEIRHEQIAQRLEFQEQKRHRNIASVVRETAADLEGKTVADHEPDHDWTARFFNNVQDVSSKEMQILWAKVLAGQVERPGSSSIHTLGCLKELDHKTAQLFARFCSACIFRFSAPELSGDMLDGRVSSLDGKAAANSLKQYGFGFGELNRLHEHGLIISDYDSWYETFRFPIFQFQKQRWVVVPTANQQASLKFRIEGPALSLAGRELSRVVDCMPIPNYEQSLSNFLLKQKLMMEPVSVGIPTLKSHHP